MMATQRVRATFEFDIDDSEASETLRDYLEAVRKSIFNRIATTPDVRLTHFAWVLPRVKP